MCRNLSVPRLFCFSYRCASVYRLSKMMEIFNKELMSRQRYQAQHGESYDQSTSLSTSNSEESLEEKSSIDIGQKPKGKSMQPAMEAPNSKPMLINDIKMTGQVPPSRKRSKTGSETSQEAGEETEQDEESEIEPEAPSDSTDEFDLSKVNSNTTAENVEFIVNTFRKKTNLDDLTLKWNMDYKDKTALMLSVGNLMPYEQRAGFVNIVDPSFSTHSLRRRILEMLRLDMQEAFFHIFSEEVAKLSFR